MIIDKDFCLCGPYNCSSSVYLREILNKKIDFFDY